MTIRNKRLILAGGFGIILIFLGILLLSHQPQSLTTSDVLAHNIQFPEQTSAKEIRFFTGSSFASLDLSNGSTKNLTGIFSLPAVDKVKWSKAAVLFEASGYSYQDQLNYAIASYGLNPQNSYWWSLSFAPGATPQLVGQDNASAGQQILDAVWSADGSNIYYLGRFLSGQPNIYRQLATATGSTLVAQGVNAGKLLWTDGQRMATVSPTNDKLNVALLSSPSKPTVSAGNSGRPAVSNDGKVIVYNRSNSKYQSNELGIGDLYSLNTTNNKQKLLAKAFSGYTGVSSASLPLALQAGTKPVLFVGGQDQKLKSYSLKGFSFKLNALFSNASSASNPLIYGTNEQNELYAFSKQPPAAKLKQGIVPFKESIYRDSFTIQNDSAGTGSVVTLTVGPYATARQAALDYITALGLDYNQINLTWQATPSVAGSIPFPVVKVVQEGSG